MVEALRSDAPRKGVIRQHVLFSGRVQGVGFRYTACRIADRFAVTGWIQNLPDGRVEAVVEGEPSEIEDFLAAVREHMRPNISQCIKTESAATGEYLGFQIRV